MSRKWFSCIHNRYLIFRCTKKEGNTSFTITKDLQDVRLTLKVTEASPPTVTLTGPTTLTIDGMENPETDIFDTGVKVLDSVTISVMRASSPALVARDQRGSLIPDYESMVKKFERDVVLLDSCTLKLRNERRADGVTLNVSDVLVRSLQMEVKHSAVSAVENQWVISGVGIANEIPEFLSVLRDVRLKLNREHVAALSSVVLKVSLSCMEMFSKTPSAEYVLEVRLQCSEPYFAMLFCTESCVGREKLYCLSTIVFHSCQKETPPTVSGELWTSGFFSKEPSTGKLKLVFDKVSISSLQFLE